MTDENQGASPKNDAAQLETGEDAEMRAARRELKQSSISDTPGSASDAGHDSATDEVAEGRPATPSGGASEAQNEELKEQVLSPKKKRGHDQLEGDRDAEDDDATSVASTDSAKDRACRLEPEKKRHRDEEPHDTVTEPLRTDTQTIVQNDDNTSRTPSDKSPKPSSTAFASSGFGKLAEAPSAFAALGATQRTSFGSSVRPPSFSLGPSGSLPASQPTTTAPKLTFGSNGGASPFAGLSSAANGLGTRLTGGFGSSLAGSKPLAGFAGSGVKSLQSGKAAKPFGAPDSDPDDANEDDEDEGDNESQADEAQCAVTPDKDADEKKKTKLHKVEIDNGEAGEATIVSVRAKMFSLDKEAGWKERGAGMLKINAPRSCVEFDDTGSLIPGSFDASGLRAEKEGGDDSKGRKVVRLIMRQDQTHRVILNAAIVPAMQFQEKASLKSVAIIFTAFEGEQASPICVTVKMSAVNARSFMNEIDMIQRQLRGT